MAACNLYDIIARQAKSSGIWDKDGKAIEPEAAKGFAKNIKNFYDTYYDTNLPLPLKSNQVDLDLSAYKREEAKLGREADALFKNLNLNSPVKIENTDYSIALNERELYEILLNKKNLDVNILYDDGTVATISGAKALDYLKDNEGFKNFLKAIKEGNYKHLIPYNFNIGTEVFNRVQFQQDIVQEYDINDPANTINTIVKKYGDTSQIAVNEALNEFFRATDTTISYDIAMDNPKPASADATFTHVNMFLSTIAGNTVKGSYQFFASTAVHEKIHAATHTLYEQNPAFKKKIQRYYQIAVASSTPETSGLYGLYNEQEFMAEALSNPKFQNYLNQIWIGSSDTTLFQAILNAITSALEKVIPQYNKHSLLHNTIVEIVNEMGETVQSDKRLNGVKSAYKDIFNAVEADGSISAETIAKAGEPLLHKFASEYNLDIAYNKEGRAKFVLLGHNNPFDRTEDQYLNRTKLHFHMNEFKLPGILYKPGFVRKFYNHRSTADYPINFNTVNNTSEIETLDDIFDSIGGPIQKPTTENGNFYYIDNEPYWRATSYLGLHDSNKEETQLLQNASRVGNLIDEIGKRVFRGDDVNSITKKSVLDFLKDEDNSMWGNELIADEEFATIMQSLQESKKELMAKHDFVDFKVDIIVWDKDIRVAGEIDIVGIKKNGTKVVIDLKTRRVGLTEYDEMRKFQFITDKDKHSMQTNLYSDMAGDIFKEEYGAPMILLLSPTYRANEEVENVTFAEVEDNKLFSIIQLERKDRSKRFDFTKDGVVNTKTRDNTRRNSRQYRSFYNRINKKLNPGAFEQTIKPQVEVLHTKLRQLQEKLEQYNNILAKSNSEDTGKLNELIDRIKDELTREIDEGSVEEQLLIAEEYFDFSYKALVELQERLSRDDDTDYESQIETYYQVMKFRGVFETTRELFQDLNQINDDLIVSASRYKTVKDKYSELQGQMALADSKIQSKLHSIVNNILKSSYLGSKAEIKYRDKYFKQGISLGLKESSAKDYALEKLHDPEIKQEIMEEYANEIDELINSNQNDMLTSSFYLVSDAGVNNPFIQIMHTMIMKYKQSTSELVNSSLVKYTKQVKELNLTRAQEKALIERDEDGNALLIGEYRYEYVTKHRELRRKIKDLQNDLVPGSSDYKIQLSKIYKAKKERTAWLKANTELKGGIRVPSAKWKNSKYTNLSPKQMQALNIFKKIIDNNDNGNINVMRLSAVETGFKYYRLPGILATSFEKITKGDALGAIKKKFDETTKIESDDTDYGQVAEQGSANIKRVYTGLDGKPILTVPIHYRGRLGDRQSTDLFTIFALEQINGIRYANDSDLVKRGQLLKDFIDTKSFNKTEGFAKRQVGSVYLAEDSTTVDTMSGDASNVSKMLDKMLKNQVYAMMQDYAGSIQLGGQEFDINRMMGFVASYTAFANMSFKLLGATNNWITGNVSIALESVGREFMTTADLSNAKGIYRRNIAGIVGDIGKPVKTSYVNQLMRFFDIQSELNTLDGEFERRNKAFQLMKGENALFMHSMGEHEIHATLMLGMLSGIKITNRKGKYLNDSGKVTTKDKAASMLDIFYMDADGILQKKDWVDKQSAYSSFDTMLTLNKEDGGMASIRTLLKDRVIRTQGAFGKDTQAALDRLWYGKLLKQFKKHVVPHTLNRLRGIDKAFRSTDAISENEKYYNFHAKTEEYGYYTSFLRYVSQAVIPNLKYKVLQGKEPGTDSWKEMAVHERANVRKAITEIGFIALMYGLTVMAKAAAEGAGDDEWIVYNIAYLLRRQVTDAGLAYYDPSEAWRLTDTPAAAIRSIDNIRAVLGYLLPWNWGELGEDYESGYNRGKNKAATKLKRALLLDRMKQFDSEFIKQKYKNIDQH